MTEERVMQGMSTRSRTSRDHLRILPTTQRIAASFPGFSPVLMLTSCQCSGKKRQGESHSRPHQGLLLPSPVPLLTLQPEHSLKNGDSINLFALPTDTLKRLKKKKKPNRRETHRRGLATFRSLITRLLILTAGPGPLRGGRD